MQWDFFWARSYSNEANWQYEVHGLGQSTKIVDEHPNAIIRAGLLKDWGNTSGLIYAKGKYYDCAGVYGCSCWATPIVDVDGEEIECWTYEVTEERSNKPSWWGNGQELLSVWDYYENED